MSKSCTGFGHRDLLVNINDELTNIIEFLITLGGVDTFYVGEQGDFDRAFVSCVKKAKKRFPYISIILVLPYLTKTFTDNKDYYACSYDEIICYSSDKRVHPKSAFYKRNRYMVDKSDFVIAYLYRNHGGAYTAISYAKRQGKKVIPINRVRPRNNYFLENYEPNNIMY